MTTVLEARGICAGYGGEDVVGPIDLEVRAGEFVALVGANGSGKTTLLRVLLGLHPASAGTVRLFDRARREDALHRVGFVPQRLYLPSDMPATVLEVVRLGRVGRRWWKRLGTGDHAAVDAAIEAVGLDAMRDRRVGELSGGQQQRVLIAKALATEPDLLILDEPTAGVDAASQRAFRTALAHVVEERGATVLLVSHELGAVADDLDRILIVQRSIVFDGSPQELAARGVSLGLHADDLPVWLERLV